MAMSSGQASGFGTLAGMAGGAALAPFTAGLSLLPAMAMGGGLGGMAGGMFGGEEEEPPTPWEIYKKSMKKIYPMMARDADRVASNSIRQGEKAAMNSGLTNTSIMNSIRTGAQETAGQQKQQANSDLYKQSFGMARAQPQPQQQQGGGMDLSSLGMLLGMGGFGQQKPVSQPNTPQTTTGGANIPASMMPMLFGAF